jgi:hypothetical protein
MYAPLFCRNPFQARLCRRRLSSELIRCLRLSVRWISTLKKFPGALQREMRCLHAGGQLCECFPDVCTYYLYANPSPSADGRSASIEREKYIYIHYIFTCKLLNALANFAAPPGEVGKLLHSQNKISQPVRVGVCVAGENV